MSKKLSTHDGDAVDLILDQAKAAYSQPDPAVHLRVGGVQRVLRILDHWHVGEPPADLVERTMARVMRSIEAPVQLDDRRADPAGPMA